MDTSHEPNVPGRTCLHGLGSSVLGGREELQDFVGSIWLQPDGGP